MKEQDQVRLHVGTMKARGRGGRRGLAAVWSALVLGGLVWAAPGESQAKERCTTKPVVCARMKAQRASEAERQAAPAQALRPARLAASSDRCITKPTVCARLRNAPAAPAPMYVASNPGTDRCTTKPAVCARLKLRRGAAPFTLANEGAPSSVD